jgi:hypothetical protein
MATSDLRELILSARHRIANAKQDPVAASTGMNFSR